MFNKYNRKDITRSEIYRLYVIEKKNITEIAEHFDCSKSCISRKINTYDITKHRKKMEIPDDILRDMIKEMTVSEISKQIDVPRSTIYSRLKSSEIEQPNKRRRKRRPDHSQDERIKNLKNKGTPIHEISIITGLSKSTVYRRLKRD